LSWPARWPLQRQAPVLCEMRPLLLRRRLQLDASAAAARRFVLPARPQNGATRSERRYRIGRRRSAVPLHGEVAVYAVPAAGASFRANQRVRVAREYGD
jgi:hypothetical protein